MLSGIKSIMKKILIIAYNDLNNSGVPNVIYQIIKALHNEYFFDVLIFGSDDYYYKKLKNEGINVNLIKYIENKPKNKVKRWLWHICKKQRERFNFMEKLLDHNDYFAIHSFKETDSWPFFKAAKRKGIKKRIFHCNVDLEINHWTINNFFKKRNKRLSIKYSTLLVGVSKKCCEIAFGRNKFDVLYNSYDEQKYNNNIRNEVPNGDLIITQIGTLCDNKNQLFSLKVLNELTKLSHNVKLNLIGYNGKTQYYIELIEYVKKNNLENRVLFLKKLDDISTIYKTTTFVVVPSKKEGFSLVTVEAQACGIEVFASSNIPSEVNCGGVTFLDLDNPKDWARKLYQEFLEKKNMSKTFNVSDFSFEKFKNKLKHLYEK